MSNPEASARPIRAGIVGVSGYSGMELARILARHPSFVLTFATSDKWAGRPVGAKVPLTGPVADIVCVSQADGAARFRDADVVFLCTPPEASIELAPRVLDAGARVVDLSGAFRLDAKEYPRWYGFEHPRADLLASAVYCMPEATGTTVKLRDARLVSNPGCYPTASSLAVLPLLQAGLIERDGLIIDAKSGTTGAGRKGSEDWSFSEIHDDFRAYRVLKHQHTPEIERVLAFAGMPGAKVTFTAHLLPLKRGILATAYGRLRAGAYGSDATAAVTSALQTFAERHPFVYAAAPEEVTLRSVVGTNRVVIGARADADRGVVVSFAAIDNLVKGAAGQAVQNANLMFGLAETTGLVELSGFLP